MRFDLQTLLGMAWRSITNPREGAEEVLALGIPRSALWPIMLLVVVLSSLLTLFTNLTLGAVGQAVPAGIQSQPILIGGLQLVLLIVMVVAIFSIGRRFGGKASFEEVMLLVAWLQFVLLCIQVVQALFLVIMRCRSFCPPPKGAFWPPTCNRSQTIPWPALTMRAILRRSPGRSRTGRKAPAQSASCGCR